MQSPSTAARPRAARWTVLGLALAAGLCLPGPLQASGDGTSDPGDDDRDLTELSLQELMDVEISIVSRRGEKLSEVPGAVYVISGDEIRRAGHASVPEALRMVPGFYVSRWITYAWDVTSRGFGAGTSQTSFAFQNELMVMIDGVVVYTPLFGGVWWPLQDVDIDDVDRIEIIRGPGGVLWGSNAIHGVVHVITKSAAETQGVRLSLRSSTDDRQGSLRGGGPLGENGHFRFWARYSGYDTLADRFAPFDFDWQISSVGFRADWADERGREFSLWTRAYESEFDDVGFDLVNLVPIQVTNEKRGGSLFGSFNDPESGSRWQAWLASDDQDLPTFVDIHIDQFDLEYQKDLVSDERHRLTVGAGYRVVSSDLSGDDPTFVGFDPEEQIQNSVRLFGRDSIKLPSLDSTVLIGVQVEHNEFTGLEVQPTVRWSWEPVDEFTLWSAVSRAVRTPSLEERTLGPGSVVLGSNDFDSESLIGYELGLRAQVCETAAIDIATYYNDFDQVRFLDFDAGTGQFTVTNAADGYGYGVEVGMDMTPRDDWKLRGTYTYQRGTYQSDTGLTYRNEEYTPNHIASLRSYYDLTEKWELDTGVYVVEGLQGPFEAAEYLRADVRLGYHPADDLEFFVGVQDVTNAKHSEYDGQDNPRRGFVFGLRWGP